MDITEYMKKLQDLQSLVIFRQNEAVFANLGSALRAAHATLQAEKNASLVQRDISSFFFPINKPQDTIDQRVANENLVDIEAMDEPDVEML